MEEKQGSDATVLGGEKKEDVQIFIRGIFK